MCWNRDYASSADGSVACGSSGGGGEALSGATTARCRASACDARGKREAAESRTHDDDDDGAARSDGGGDDGAAAVKGVSGGLRREGTRMMGFSVLPFYVATDQRQIKSSAIMIACIINDRLYYVARSASGSSDILDFVADL
ncbi:hypothetical protein Scep_028442 [Stephania cephalantha]|uniref:Uncharacterized protein n=1 Tax=Stephania cephalantha TaxID=152367 RepID=A0AAP0EC40_9MAGN